MARYLAGDLSEEEKTSFEAQLITNQAVADEFEAYMNVWAITHASDSSGSFDTKAAWEAVQARTSEPKVVPITPRKRPYSFMKIAATLLLLAVAGYFVTTMINNGDTNSPMIEVVSERGVKEVTLPDGSKVRMNAHSTLAYSEDFNSANRQIRLSGGADFDVTHNADLPFVVETGASRIKVLGTQFDITAYPNEAVELNVTDGRVAFSSMESVDEEEVVVKGQMAILDIESQEIEVGEIKDQNFSGWWTRKLVYENESLKEVLEDLEKVYWVEFEYDEKSLSCDPITATWENETIEGILDLLVANGSLEYSKGEENKIKLSGKGCSD